VTLRSEAVVVAPEGIEPAEIAPLCCAGVTLFTAMRNMNARPGDLVAIQGIGYVPVLYNVLARLLT
jgi:propanol-preferring alcohol dehydrogenase